MKPKSLKLFIYIILAMYCSGPLADSLLFKVLEVEDGDTIVVESKGVESRIQLSGIDAPENTDNAKLKLDIKTTGLDAEALMEIGDAATEHIRSLLPLGNTVMLNANMEQQDKYGRIPAIVSNSNGLRVNEAMVNDGYAALLTRYPLGADFKKSLQRHQIDAKKSNRGLWGTYPETARAWFKE